MSTVCVGFRGDNGVVGVEARIEGVEVIGGDLDGLKAVSVRTRDREIDDGGIDAVPRCADPRSFVVFEAWAGFRDDSSCRSLARRRVSLVRPERLRDGVCWESCCAVGGDVPPGNPVDLGSSSRSAF